MRPIQLTIVALALLLGACAPTLFSSRPTPTATTVGGAPVTPPETPAAGAGDESATDENDIGENDIGENATGENAGDESAGSNTAENIAAANTPVVIVGEETPAENEAITETTTTTDAEPIADAAPVVADSSAIPTTPPQTANATASPAAIAAAPSQTQGYEVLTSPVDLIASYYDAINREEYERAYSYWQQPPLDYDSFAGGYADTASVQVIVQPPTRIEGAAGSLYVEVPVFLIAQHHDGSQHSFAGCIVTRKSNVPAPDVPEENWYLYQARLVEVANNANIPAQLATGCAT